MIGAVVTHIGFQNGEFRISRRKLKGFAISIENYIVHQLILPPMTPQGQRFSFSNDSSRGLE
jgi:hypothetical protein